MYIYAVSVLSQREGDTALHLATLRNRPEVVEELAKLGADLNAGNKVKLSLRLIAYNVHGCTRSYYTMQQDGLTALMVAANKNYVGVADALLEGGADPNQPHQVSCESIYIRWRQLRDY